MMRNIIFAILLFSQTGWSGYVPDQIAHLNLQDVALSALDFSLRTQIQNSLDKNYLVGEFPTKIESTLVPALVGVGKMIGQNDDEATGFTTSAVINILSQTYIENSELHSNSIIQKIPSAVAAGVKTFSRYKDGNSYNFYPSLILKNNLKVHRPISMTLNPIWYGFTNVPNDSDTTSAVLTAIAFHQKLNNSKISLNHKALDEIDTFVDNNRSPMFYNRFESRANTGAFMTWLFDENDPKMPRFYFATSEKGTRIPFNKNDVDCVVNANILKLSAVTKSNLKNSQKACEMLNDMIEKDERARCGVYYPNTYNLSFALASARSAGDQCLNESNQKLIVKKIIEEQNADGSWQNIKNVWIDQNLSTVFAMYSLLEFANPNDPLVYQSLIYGAHYLLKNAQLKNGVIFWKEDNFFTATAIARSLVMWKSSAYTNSIIASIFLKMNKLFPELKVKNYIKLNIETE